jgi:hypothetical protein
MVSGCGIVPLNCHCGNKKLPGSPIMRHGKEVPAHCGSAKRGKGRGSNIDKSEVHHESIYQP